MDDPALMIDAAQHAAATGDYKAAERLLREAADRQEATLGSSHPDLAITLNNLAFVSERTGKFEQAERGYRRAHAIAVASLSPGHPFIKTSLSNLVDFCEARGIPLWTKPETPIEDEPLADDDVLLPAEGDALPKSGDASEIAEALLPEIAVVALAASDAPARTRRLPLRIMAVAAVVVAGIVGMVFARQGQDRTDTSTQVVSPRLSPPPSPPPSPPTSPAPSPLTSPPPSPPPSPAPSPAPSAGSGSLTVLNAQLCRTLERSGSPDWRCTPATGEAPGTYTFYTRLLATDTTTVEHRWYRNDRVHQTMRLRVSPSPGSGFRTFSVTTVSPERAGEWKVELRAADGTVLAQERFRVH